MKRLWYVSLVSRCWKGINAIFAGIDGGSLFIVYLKIVFYYCRLFSLDSGYKRFLIVIFEYCASFIKCFNSELIKLKCICIDFTII